MPEAEDVKYKRQFRNYLLNTGLQLRYTAFIVLISATLTGALGYFVISKAHEATRVVEVRALDPTDTIAQEIAAQFAKNDQSLMIGLVIFGILLVIVLTVYGVVMTHRVAGPIFKITNYLDKLRDGKLSQVYGLRKGDQSVEFFESFKGAHDAIRKRTEEDIVLLDRAIAVAADGEVKSDLQRARADKAQALV